MKNEINALIMEAMKNHDTVRTETLRAIKSAFLNWQTSKENAGKELAEADEIQIIKKMVKQRQESVEQYLAAGRKELADARLSCPKQRPKKISFALSTKLKRPTVGRQKRRTWDSSSRPSKPRCPMPTAKWSLRSFRADWHEYNKNH